MTHPSAGSCGSSPLSRGICARRRPHRVSNWIIPALAGNTSRVYGLAAGAADHPRSRGEYCCRMISSSTRNGSSPLSRGILGGVRRQSRSPRIIPALAGNTDSMAVAMWEQEDHPRSRGEYRRYATSAPRRGGSSPLSRGILSIPSDLPPVVRIIPALAGNTMGVVLEVVGDQDHPRSRGEYVWPEVRNLDYSGSSPLSRGIRRCGLCCGVCGGIIPALAGNTLSWAFSRLRGGDHPRSRGEYPIRIAGLFPVPGSSPLSRGIRLSSASPQRLGRIIPALAGNTCRVQSRCWLLWDHPRSRGEYS